MPKTKNNIITAASLLLVGAVIALVVPAGTAHAADNIITVNSTADNTTGGNGNCTFREALANANDNSDTTSGDCAAGTGIEDVIRFAITGSGLHTISATGTYSIDEQVVIDGYSQAGSAVNTNASPLPFNGTLTIEIDMSGTSGTAFTLNSDNITLKGLVVHSAGGALIAGRSADVHHTAIQGSYINVDPTGMTQKTSTNETITFGSGAHDNLIGGTNAADRNIIIGSPAQNAISISDFVTSGPVAPAVNTTIQGNYIGLFKTGLTAATSTSTPLIIQGATGTVVGGTVAGARNVIAGNVDAAGLVTIYPGTTGVSSPTNTRIQGNYIGTDYLGASNTSLSSAVTQINAVFLGTTPILVGGDTAAAGNLIAGGGQGSGINHLLLSLASPVSSGLAILGNSFVGHPVLGGIVYGDDGNFDFVADTFITPNPNNATDGSTGPNNLVNHPVISSVSQVSGSQDAVITFSYSPQASLPVHQGFKLQFYSTDTNTTAGYAEGKTLLTSVDVPSGGVTDQQVSVTLPAGESIVTATATLIASSSPFGYGSTSEFSPAMVSQVSALPSILPEVGSLPGLLALVLGLGIATALFYIQRRSTQA